MIPILLANSKKMANLSIYNILTVNDRSIITAGLFDLLILVFMLFQNIITIETKIFKQNLFLLFEKHMHLTFSSGLYDAMEGKIKNNV